MCAVPSPKLRAGSYGHHAVRCPSVAFASLSLSSAQPGRSSPSLLCHGFVCHLHTKSSAREVEGLGERHGGRYDQHAGRLRQLPASGLMNRRFVYQLIRRRVFFWAFFVILYGTTYSE
jgi:hypothetical protein